MPASGMLTGIRFGRLVVGFRDGSQNGKSVWMCLCDCGNEMRAVAGNLKSGMTASCGCLQRERTAEASLTHGASRRHQRSNAYDSWGKMIQRCTNPTNKDWRHYGGRGITVCDRWRDFNLFLQDMGERPDGLTLERLDNDQGYCPRNCAWATRKQQANNTRRQKEAICQTQIPAL